MVTARGARSHLSVSSHSREQPRLHSCTSRKAERYTYIGVSFYAKWRRSLLFGPDTHGRFSLETWDGRRTIAWGRCTPLDHCRSVGTKIRQLLSSQRGARSFTEDEEEEYDDENSKLASNFSCEETKVHV